MTGALTAANYGGALTEPTTYVVEQGEGFAQLRDDVTGALLYDAVTGAPLTW